MATERLDIVISEKGGKEVQRRLEAIGKAAKKVGEGSRALIRFSRSAKGSTGSLVRLDQAVRKSTVAVGRLTARLEKAGASTRRTGNNFSLLQQAIKRIGVENLIRQTAQLADQYTNLQNRLRAISGSFEEAGQASEALFEIANRNRTGVDGVVSLYAKLTPAAEELNASQSEILKVTEAVSQAFALSGASASESAGGIRQLSQALASGVLRGDEFNSIAENAPEILRLLSNELGVSTGALRELASQGKLTSDVVFDALLNNADDLADRFRRLPPTISSALTVLQNSLTQAMGQFDQSTGASAAFARAILIIADNVGQLAFALGTTLALQAIPSAIKALGALKVALLRNPIGIIAVAITSVIGLLAGFSGDIAVSKDGLITLKDVGVAAFQVISEKVKDATSSIAKFLSPVLDAVQSLLSHFNNLDFSASSIIKSLAAFADDFLNLPVAFMRGLFTFIRSSFDELLRFMIAKALNAARQVELLVNASIRKFGLPDKGTFITGSPFFEILEDEATRSLEKGADGFINTFDSKRMLAPFEDALESFSSALLSRDRFTFFQDSVDEIAEIARTIATQRQLTDQLKAIADTFRSLFPRFGESVRTAVDSFVTDTRDTFSEGVTALSRIAATSLAGGLTGVVGGLAGQVIGAALSDEKEKRKDILNLTRDQVDAANEAAQAQIRNRNAVQATLDALRLKGELIGKSNLQQDRIRFQKLNPGPVQAAEFDILTLQNATLKFNEAAAQLRDKVRNAPAEVQQETEQFISDGTLKLQQAAETLAQGLAGSIGEGAGTLIEDTKIKMEQAGGEIGSAVGTAFVTAFKAALGAGTTGLLSSLTGIGSDGTTAAGTGRQTVPVLTDEQRAIITQNLDAVSTSIDSINSKLDQFSNKSTQAFNQASAGAQSFGQNANSIGEQLNEVFSNAFKSLEDALVSFVTTGKLDFKSLINSILADLARMVIRMLIIQPLMGFFGGLFGGIFGFSKGGFVGGASLPGFASGGLVGAGDRIPAFAPGGIVGGFGGSTSDNILARLSPGEFVMNAAATKGNRRAFEYINKTGQIPVMAGGGGVTVVNNVTVNSNGGNGEQVGQDVTRQLDVYMKTQVVKILQQQRRPGGILRSDKVR